MVRNITLIFTLSLFVGFVFGQQTPLKQAKTSENAEFSNAVGKWFAAWELVSRDVYHIDKLQPVEFVFFDDKFVYSTSNVTLPAGKIVEGPKLLGKSFVWKKTAHTGSLTLPDKNVMPISLTSFAGQLNGENNNAFFVMPLPNFWHQAGVKSDELGLENLVTGVFLHEFSHSLQMRNFGKQISVFEKENNFETDFSDDIVQNLFGKNAGYTNSYLKEINAFYVASAEKNKSDKIALTAEAINLLRKRHTDWFTGRYENLKPIDDFFLTMEGLGQYTMYTWLTHKRGANLSAEIALKGVRRGGKWWSQEEGLALFLILEQFSKPKDWAKNMFGDKIESVIDLISQRIEKVPRK